MLDISNLNLLSVETICQSLGVSRTTLDRWVRNTRDGVTGKGTFPLPCTTLGNSPRWQKEVVNAWLNNNGKVPPAIDFQALVTQIIHDAKKVHQVYGGIEEDLSVLICGANNKACDKIRSMFEEGVGDVLVKSHIRFYFIAGDDLEADNLALVRGNVLVRCLIQSGHQPSPAVQKAIHNGLLMASTAVERRVTRMILEIPLQ